MDWQGWVSILGLGLTILTWVASMIWHTLPRGLLISLFILGTCLMLAWPAALLFGWVRKFSPSYGLIIIIIAGAVIGGAVFGIAYYITEPSPGVKPTLAATAVFMECHLVALPISIPPNSTIHLIPLNKKRMKTVKWGFSDRHNNSNKTIDWPNVAIIKEATEKQNPALFAWRCDVSNHGHSTVLDVSIPIKVWFDNEKPEITYQAIITPLPTGATYTFYLVNDCPPNVSAIWPDTARLQVLGESERREVPLRRTFKSPIDQIMMLFGSNTRLIGGEPCE